MFSGPEEDWRGLSENISNLFWILTQFLLKYEKFRQVQGYGQSNTHNSIDDLTHCFRDRQIVETKTLINSEYTTTNNVEKLSDLFNSEVQSL